jgi:hypothetical protein
MAWQYNHLTNSSGGVLSAGDPTGYTTDADKTQHVVYRGTDNHIHELSFDGEWHHTDLTSAAQGKPPSATADPAAIYFWSLLGEPAALYRGTHNHIHELLLDGEQWKDSDLTQVISPRPMTAAGDATAIYHWPQENSLRVFYRGTDGHLCLLSIHGHAGAQNHGDITGAATGNPPAAVGNPAGTVWNDDQHVVYRDSDGRLHELLGRFDGIDCWSHIDLSDTSTGEPPNAAGDPAVYVRDADSTLHVVFRGTDNHIHELCFRA